MAKVFLDTNAFIDLVEQRDNKTIEELNGHDIFISPLSVHILMYVTKRKVPYPRLSNTISHFLLVPFDEGIASHSLTGPTSDFEDNVQLHSAAQSECDLFLTSDLKLLNLKFFGKVQILPTVVE